MSLFTTNPFGNPNFRDITKQCTFSWEVLPTSITAGAFDDIIDGNHTTKLEFYSTFAGATSQAQLQFTLPHACTFMVFPDIGVGAQIGADSSAGREVKFDTSLLSERSPSFWNTFLKTYSDTAMSTRFRRIYQGLPSTYGDAGRFIFYSNTAGDFAFEIYTVNILEIVGV